MMKREIKWEEGRKRGSIYEEGGCLAHANRFHIGAILIENANGLRSHHLRLRVVSVKTSLFSDRKD